MRVLIATEHAGIVGGVETHLRAVLPLLRNTGFEIGLLTNRDHDPATGILSGCPDVSRWTYAGQPLAGVLRNVAQWKPDVVYQHGIANPEVEAELAGRFPSVLYAHGYHGTCISGTKCFAATGYQACSRTLGRGCLAAYLPRRCGGRNPITMLQSYRHQRRRNATLALHRAVLVASTHMRDEYRRHGVADPQLVPLFPPGVDSDANPPSPSPSSGRVLFLGRITRLKGLDHLITALPLASAELARPLTLVVAGDGPYRKAAESLALKRGVRAEFLGWVGLDRREAEMRAADVLAVPSVWPEPFGLVGIEAGCVGLPAVGYATGGIPDWLVPGVSGESAPGDRPDPLELAAALVRALKDEAHRHRLAVGAWETASQSSVSTHLRQLKHILSKTS